MNPLDKVKKDEATARGQLVAAYSAATKDLQQRIAALLRATEGRALGLGELQRLRQYSAVEAALADKLGTLAQQASSLTVANQRQAVALALDNARLQFPRFTTVPARALDRLAGATANGTPLDRALGQYANTTRQNVTEALVRGVARGANPARIARDVQTQLGSGLAKATTIVRTETMRAFRGGSIEAYRANGVKQYEWLASKTERTCQICKDLDGKRFDLDHTPPAHVNCRCTIIPVVE